MNGFWSTLSRVVKGDVVWLWNVRARSRMMCVTEYHILVMIRVSRIGVLRTSGTNTI